MKVDNGIRNSFRGHSCYWCSASYSTCAVQSMHSAAFIRLGLITRPHLAPGWLQAVCRLGASVHTCGVRLENCPSPLHPSSDRAFRMSGKTASNAALDCANTLDRGSQIQGDDRWSRQIYDLVWIDLWNAAVVAGRKLA